MRSKYFLELLLYIHVYKMVHVLSQTWRIVYNCIKPYLNLDLLLAIGLCISLKASIGKQIILLNLTDRCA